MSLGPHPTAEMPDGFVLNREKIKIALYLFVCFAAGRAFRFLSSSLDVVILGDGSWEGVALFSAR